MGYINEGNGPGLALSAVIPFFVTWMFVAVRVYVRWFMLKVWKLEDWLFIGSQIVFSFLCFTGLMATVYGNGQHLKDVNFKDLVPILKYWYASELLYTVTSLFIRLSIGCFLLRICINKTHIWIIRVLMALMLVLSIAYFIFLVFQCQPVYYFWTQATGATNGKCLQTRTISNFTIVFAVFAAATDIAFAVLPIFLIWKLKMNPRAKFIAGGLMALGIIAGCSIFVRIVYINRLTHPKEDFTFVTFKVVVWSILEPAIGICCMATTTYRPLFKSFKDRSTQGSRSRGTQDVLNTNQRTAQNKSNIQSRGSRAGYTRNGSQDSLFEDGIAFQNMKSTIEGGESASEKTWSELHGEEDKGGIVYSRTVEITHTQAKGGHDRV